MKNYILFGIKEGDLRGVGTRIEKVLGIELKVHESGYHCGEYLRSGDIGGEHFILQRNFDDFEDDWTEPDAKDCELLLYANETSRGASIVDALGSFAKVIREEEVP